MFLSSGFIKIPTPFGSRPLEMIDRWHPVGVLRAPGGGGDSSMKCPDVCVVGLKMHAL